MPVGPRPVGLASVAPSGGFPHPCRAFTFRPSSESFESDSFSRAWLPLRSSFAHSPWRFTAMSYRGFSPLRDVSAGVHSVRVVPRCRATFRPQAFATSRRFTPLADSWACFIPQPRPGFFLRPGTSPPPKPVRLVAVPFPLVVGRLSLAGKPVATRGDLDFEALILGAVRSARLVISLPIGRFPLRVPSSFGISLPRRKPGSPSHPLSTFTPRVCACT
jgi:hypothetical protein